MKVERLLKLESRVRGRFQIQPKSDFHVNARQRTSTHVNVDVR